MLPGGLQNHAHMPLLSDAFKQRGLLGLTIETMAHASMDAVTTHRNEDVSLFPLVALAGCGHLPIG